MSSETPAACAACFLVPISLHTASTRVPIPSRRIGTSGFPDARRSDSVFCYSYQSLTTYIACVLGVPRIGTATSLDSPRVCVYSPPHESTCHSKKPQRLGRLASRRSRLRAAPQGMEPSAPGQEPRLPSRLFLSRAPQPVAARGAHHCGSHRAQARADLAIAVSAAAAWPPAEIVSMILADPSILDRESAVRKGKSTPFLDGLYQRGVQ